MEFDLSRIILSFFVGYFLSLSGSLSQITTQNNISSPSTLGFDGLAVLSILCSQFVIMLTKINIGLENLSFLLFSIIFVIIFYVSKKVKNKNHIENKMEKIILIGIGFNLFVGAVFSIVQFLFMSMNINFPSGIWFGNFKFFNTSTIIIFLILFFLCQVYILKHSKNLRLISIGTDFARGLGVDTLKTQRQFLLLSLFLTGLVISYFGVFSFLGLIFPHLLRLIPSFTRNMKRELTYGPYITGLVLSGLDVLCYNFTFYGAEIPVGMVSSILGSFLLILLLVKGQKSA